MWQVSCSVSHIKHAWKRVSEWGLHPQKMAFSGRRHNNNLYLTFNQLSVNEIDSSNRFIQWDVSRARCRQPPNKLNHRVPSVSRVASWLRVVWEPVQCSHNPSLSWQVGNIVGKFPTLPNTRHTMLGYEKFHVNSQITRRSNYGKKQPEKHNIHLAQIFFVHLSAGSTANKQQAWQQR